MAGKKELAALILESVCEDETLDSFYKYLYNWMSGDQLSEFVDFVKSEKGYDTDEED
jgi:hypothetical protein